MFTCTLNLANLPAEVRRGNAVSATVTVSRASAPVRSIQIAAEGYGISQHLKKTGDMEFTLEIKVPMLVPPGNYQYAVWAVSEGGEKSAKQVGRVVIK